MGLLDAFTKTGPNREPTVEDTFDADFNILFGPEPSGPIPGQRWNVRHYAEIIEWRELRREFDGLVPVELPEESVALVVEETQGIPIPWVDKRGRKFVAVVQPTARLKRIPLATFVKLPPPAIAQAVLNNIIQRGGFVDPFPERHHPTLRERNEQNKQSFGS